MHNTKFLARTAMAALMLLGFSVTAAAQGRVEKNVVYGMYSGSALLLDVHHGPTFPGAKNPPDYKAAMVKWFDEHLRRASSSSNR